MSIIQPPADLRVCGCEVESLIEDSYYEDGLNGNLPGGWPEAKLNPVRGWRKERDPCRWSCRAKCCHRRRWRKLWYLQLPHLAHKSNDNIKGAAAANPFDYSEQRQKDPTAPRAQFTFIDELLLENGDPFHVKPPLRIPLVPWP